MMRLNARVNAPVVLMVAATPAAAMASNPALRIDAGDGIIGVALSYTSPVAAVEFDSGGRLELDPNEVAPMLAALDRWTQSPSPSPFLWAAQRIGPGSRQSVDVLLMAAIRDVGQDLLAIKLNKGWFQGRPYSNFVHGGDTVTVYLTVGEASTLADKLADWLSGPYDGEVYLKR